jgi:hypothetical protein
MLEILCVILFIGAPLFVLITFLLTRKGNNNSLMMEEDMPLSHEEVYKTIPLEFLQHLRFSVRYSPVKKKFGSGQNYVYLEEQLRYDNVPLTDWIKHDVPIKEGYQPSPQMLRRISLLKQYVPNKPVAVAPRLDVVAGGAR